MTLNSIKMMRKGSATMPACSSVLFRDLGVATFGIAMFGILLLSGCGQKGNLYMPGEGDGKAKFILYNPKAASPDSTADSDSTAGVTYSEQELNEAILADPQDY